MSIFGKYSTYYNLLYKDKDYTGEAEYVHNLIQKHNHGASTIMDLGCGTGIHDTLLAKKGYVVTGVDMSDEMLAIAASKLSTINHQPSTLNFLQGDIRNMHLNQTFDTVISLFHVMSYQTTNEDLKSSFKTAKAHINKGGLFIFDCWYGPAVLTDKPVVRVKRLEDEKISVTRICEPVMYPNDNIVEVNYHVFIRDKATDKVEEIKETHRLRYLFKPEIEELLRVEGLELISCEEWMTGGKLGFNTWSGCFVCKG